jgi:peptide deformylase
VSLGFVDAVMYNPVLLSKDTPYEAEEGCLSLDGTRRTKRYRNIEVEYRNAAWKRCRERYSGWIAQIIQHEMDHLDGVII